MIVLDTNIVSEAMRPEPAPQVRDWLNACDAHSLYLTSITLAEIFFGVAALSVGQRKVRLLKVFDGQLRLFEGRILSFDARAARTYAQLAVLAKANGRGFPTPDGYIAAIASAHGYDVASRDVSPFEAVGLKVINPWHEHVNS